MSDLIERLKVAALEAVFEGDFNVMSDALYALAAKDAEIARLREALASLHNEMTGAFGRIEAVSEAVAKDMRRIARAALNGEAGNG